MSENITLFSGYNFSENRTTNYCLLVLKTLYEENPKYLADILGALLGESFGDLVGVKFSQQEKKKLSVPDGLITQNPFTIYIETKNWDWFYDDQLKAHLKALNTANHGTKILIALGNFDNSARDRFDSIKAFCEQTYHKTIVFEYLSFEDFLMACEELEDLSKNLLDMLEDFRHYLSEQELLSSWEKLLDVVNCAGLPQEVIDGNIYMCPATGGSYSHLRSKYFGMYKNKKVERVALIEAVVELESPDSAKVKWDNLKGLDTDYIKVAREKHGIWRKDDYPTIVFILGQLIETAFYKGTKGPMRGSKRYFDIGELMATNAEDLAAKLKDKNWPDNSRIVKP